MEVKASLRMLRMAPRKVRLVVDTIRGLKATDAEVKLQFVQKAASLPVLKLLRSAMANAEHNFKLDRETLFVKTITADGGPTLKRSRPRAHGRAAPIRKRTTHINIILSDEKPVKATSASVAKNAKAAPKASAIAKKKAVTPRRTAKPAAKAADTNA